MALNERVNHLKEFTPEHLTCILQHVKELSSLVTNTLHLTSLNKTTNGSVNPIEKQLEQSMKQIGAALVETKNLKSRVDRQDFRIRSLENVKDQSTLPVSLSCSQQNEQEESFKRESFNFFTYQSRAKLSLPLFTVAACFSFLLSLPSIFYLHSFVLIVWRHRWSSQLYTQLKQLWN